ncbi:MAG: response regulator, partial [Actinobacteria bacterium]|nr:response regulator [Actinomycetota bacterium]
MLVIQRPNVEVVSEAEQNRQRFAISPLEPGFGHTLGNALRRTLLSSIPGAAITSVQFDDALHEFSTIAGVTEDVTDIILNLKDVVLTSTADHPVTLRLDVRGPADVTAGDIKTTADVEILNPALHIATLNDKGRLGIDLTVGVLLVDDRRSNLMALRALLEPLRCDIVLAETGEEALQRLLMEDFAVILLDVQLPGLDGFEVAELIKQRERTRHVPLIFLTATTGAQTAMRGYSVGAVDFVSKPFDPVVLRSKV